MHSNVHFHGSSPKFDQFSHLLHLPLVAPHVGVVLVAEHEVLAASGANQEPGRHPQRATKTGPLSCNMLGAGWRREGCPDFMLATRMEWGGPRELRTRELQVTIASEIQVVQQACVSFKLRRK
jgi:hypothetical protein